LCGKNKKFEYSVTLLLLSYLSLCIGQRNTKLRGKNCGMK